MDKPRVKPLEWETPCAANNHIYQAHSPWGTYGIHICGGRHQAWLEAHEKPYERWLGDGYVGSVCEAKAAAQADYESRILAALEPVTVQEALAVVEGYPAAEHGSLPTDPHECAKQVKAEILAAIRDLAEKE